MHLNNLFHVRKNIVSDDFCNDIIETGESKLFEDGKVESDNDTARSSKVSWINDMKYKTPLSQFIQSANIESDWNFSLKEFEELQYTIYNIGDHYNWHIDTHPKPYENGMIRKLSFTLCLNDEFEGGDFNIWNGDPRQKEQILKENSEKTNTKTIKLKKGEMLVFPSHLWHKVDKVTKGTRKVLVGWVVGNQWK